MSLTRVQPLRRLAVGIAALLAVVMVGTTWVVGRSLGRRADGQGGGLSAALQLSAELETSRLVDAMQTQQAAIDSTLTQLLAHAQLPVPGGMPVPAVAPACKKVTLPPGVTRAGVVDTETSSVLALVESGEKGCVDRQWNLSVQALAGPPYPTLEDIDRVVQMAMLGMDHAVEGKTTLVGLYREGVFVLLRHARAENGVAAFVDFKPGSLPRPPLVNHVRQDSFVAVDGVVAGYIHGGPQIGMIPAAVKRIKAGNERALELPEVMEAAASRAVLAWLFPEESDEAELALGFKEAVLPSPLPWPVTVATVSSTPWPAASLPTRLELGALLLVCLALEALVFVLFARRLARALWTMANAIRATWMVDHAAETEPTDAERAERLVDALERHAQDTVDATTGKAERFWAPGALQRLFEMVRAGMKKR